MPVAVQAVFSRESFALSWADARPLLHKHWIEIAYYQDIPLDPDVERYQALDDSGKLRIYTARVDNRLVGYAVFFVSLHPHYKTSLQASEDVLYLDPDYRRWHLGSSLIDYAERELAGEGVAAIYQHVKAKHPALGAILTSKGYELIDLIYGKRIS